MFSWRLAGAALVFALFNFKMTTCRSPGETGGGAQPAKEVPKIVSLSGVDTKNLTTREKRVWSEHVTELLAPCPDQPVNLAQCVQEKRPCKACLPAAQFLARSIERGLNGEQVEAAFKARFAPDQVKELELTGSPSKGAKQASVVIVEWADFECPACSAAKDVIDELIEENPGKVRLVFKHFPLSIHENAELAARAAVAAGKQDKFWEMHGGLFDESPPLIPAKIEKIARSIGLDMEKFQADLESEEVADIVIRDRKQGEKVDLHGTPTVFINSRRFVSAGDFATDLQEWVNLELELRGVHVEKPKPKADAKPASEAGSSDTDTAEAPSAVPQP